MSSAVPAYWEAAVCIPPVSHHAEGPLWDPRGDTLIWVDQYAGLVRSATPEGTSFLLRPPIAFDGPVGAVVGDVRGGWLVAAADGLWSLSPEGTVPPVVDVLPRDGVHRRMNDGKVDPAGRFWFGTMAMDKRSGAGSLYALDQGVVTEAVPEVTISNGLAWSPDGGTMHYIDTPTHRIDRYLTEGSALRRDGSLDLSSRPGSPDGMTIDDEGALWVAMWGASAVHRYDPSGELIGVVHVDAPQVSSVTFGGPDLDTLFITTSREDYSPADAAAHPLAGALFQARPGVRGTAAVLYRP
ncbi:SMP-30/gluconolactonase/LRE family protein [Rathayibacter sp. AY1E3]|uniref:SMP-30/gluconolactonase/LRE family protein n=1 Tax=Rathayibacter sp. AY1E3 TaxID=2080551 RepID=UPI000CE79F0D|nr:SMP-30/gluconolactonase/LRE family protein [Rathayibacter sp. AY1E3]PPH35561.1 SMP-30/gluconolactonase/LRE family protein [Rathayibacter sp. AY1E3]